MILVRWFNVYMTVDGFQLGEGFEFEHQAARETNEYPHFIETTCVPVEVKLEEVERVNR